VSGGSALPLPGEIVGGRYRIERLLGAGGMGSVFEVVHRVTGKRFAIKWMLPELSQNDEAVKRFVREAQVAGRFDHPNVVEVYDIGQERGSLYMVMELLRGESLAQHLARVRKVSPSDAAAILLPCMNAVARAHRAGIIHRDLKPANIFLCPARNGQAAAPKVLDFGISKMMDAAGDVEAQITKGGMVMGTPHYMAPEQVLGRPIDARADVYAFGVLLYELVTGQLPFPGNTYGQLVLEISTKSPPPPHHYTSGLPSGFEAMVERAMARDANARFPDLDALAHALEAFTPEHLARAADRPIPRPYFSPPGGNTAYINPALATPLVAETPQPLQRPPSQTRLVWLVTTLAGCVTALITMLLMLPRSDAGDPTHEPPTKTSLGAAIADGSKVAETPTTRDASVPENPGAARAQQESPPPAPPTPLDVPVGQGSADRVDDRVIGPWPRQTGPARRGRAPSVEDDGFGEAIEDSEPRDGVELPYGRKRTGRFGVAMQENEF
jgi:serine/threonine protein kinase